MTAAWSNVGPGAHTDGVKEILIQSHFPEVARPLAEGRDDLAALTSGRQVDELSWRTVRPLRVRVALQTHD